MTQLKTPEEILKQWLDNTQVSGRDGVLKAMQEYAEQTAAVAYDAGYSRGSFRGTEFESSTLTKNELLDSLFSK